MKGKADRHCGRTERLSSAQEMMYKTKECCSGRSLVRSEAGVDQVREAE